MHLLYLLLICITSAWINQLSFCKIRGKIKISLRSNIKFAKSISFTFQGIKIFIMYNILNIYFWNKGSIFLLAIPYYNKVLNVIVILSMNLTHILIYLFVIKGKSWRRYAMFIACMRADDGIAKKKKSLFSSE